MKYSAAIFLFLLIVSCAEKKHEKNLQITGNIEGLKEGTLYIRKLQDTMLVLLDSISISGNSSFESSFDIDSPEMLYLFLDRGVTKTTDNHLMFFAEQGQINISTDLKTFYATAKITGSKNHDLYEEYKKVNSRFNNQELDLTEAKLLAYQHKTPFSEEENQKKMDVIMKKKYLYAINFAVNNKDHEIAPYIALSEINDTDIKYLDTIHKSLSPKVLQSKYGKMLTTFITERKKLEQQ